jgi:GxxExxY protein
MSGTTQTVTDLANEIYKKLGAGYSERVYHNAFEVLLRKNGIQYESERVVPIEFMDHTIGNLRADLIVEGSLIVELKSVKNINQAMKTQVLNYLKLTGYTAGILVNFPQNQGEDCEFAVVATDISEEKDQ